jgi:RNA polymerase sigma-70 factor (ECF subfamily)
MAGAIGPERLGELFDAHAAALTLYARQWCDQSGAEDVVQEAFVALACQREPPRQLAAWLHRVVRNQAISWARKRRRRDAYEARAGQETELFAWVDDRLTADEATDLLNRLDPENREAVVLRIWSGLNFDEIARLLGCSLSTAHRRYHDGLAHLSEKLEAPCRPTSPTASRI